MSEQGISYYDAYTMPNDPNGDDGKVHDQTSQTLIERGQFRNRDGTFNSREKARQEMDVSLGESEESSTETIDQETGPKTAEQSGTEVWNKISNWVKGKGQDTAKALGFAGKFGAKLLAPRLFAQEIAGSAVKAYDNVSQATRNGFTELAKRYNEVSDRYDKKMEEGLKKVFGAFDSVADWVGDGITEAWSRVEDWDSQRKLALAREARDNLNDQLAEVNTRIEELQKKLGHKAEGDSGIPMAA